MKYIDVTASLGPDTRVYPGDPPVEVTLLTGASKKVTTRVTMLRLSAHAGTHVDAPCHLALGDRGVESLDLDTLIGPAFVLDAPPRPAGWLDFPARPTGRPRRILLRGEPVLSAACARDLVRRGVRLVGTDGLSVDPIDDPELPAHRVLLESGVIIIEGLDLAQVTPGRYELIALPLLIPGADGAPARVILGK